MLFLENIHHLIGATLSSHSHLHGPLEKKKYMCVYNIKHQLGWNHYVCKLINDVDGLKTLWSHPKS